MHRAQGGIMKKVLVILMASLVFGLVGCSAPETSTPASNEPAPASNSATPTKQAKDFDGTKYTDTGAGTMIVRTAAGTSENDNIPKITLTKDTSITQIDATFEDFNNAAVTYIYLDGIENNKGNYGYATAPITLKDDAIKAGSHTLEAVQFADDNPKGEVTVYKIAKFEIAN
jgi:hypothetical protein